MAGKVSLIIGFIGFIGFVGFMGLTAKTTAETSERNWLRSKTGTELDILTLVSLGSRILDLGAG